MAHPKKKLSLSSRTSRRGPATRPLPKLPPRPADGHKGTFGTVVVIGGSEGFIGAPALCAAGALRSGVGLARIAAPPQILPFVLTVEPSATGIARDASPTEALSALELADPEGRAVLAVGPGLGQCAELRELVVRLLGGRRPMVLDADGLNNFAAALEADRQLRLDRSPGSAPLVLTPHPGEFRRLARPLGLIASPTDSASRPDAARELARACRAVVVLKGQQTVISDGESQIVNRTGNVALATAGTGDVLTGIIASLMAQGLSALEAAVLGAHLHGLAGDLWSRRHGLAGLTAMELARLLPEAMEAYGVRRRQGSTGCH